jgi:hypothetical protein
MRRTTSGEGLLSFLLIAAVLLACSGDAWCDSCWSRCHKETLCPGNSSPANWGYHETVYFKVNTNSAPPTLWYPEDEICAAWEQWTTCGASPPKLEYYYLGQTDKEYEEQWDEENVFAWLGDWSVTGEPANAMAVTESYWNGTMYTDCLVHEADIYFNKEYYDWYQLAAAQRQRSAVDHCHVPSMRSGTLSNCATSWSAFATAASWRHVSTPTRSSSGWDSATSTACVGCTAARPSKGS